MMCGGVLVGSVYPMDEYCPFFFFFFPFFFFTLLLLVILF